MHLLEVRNPVAPRRDVSNTLTTCQRPGNPDDETVGLLWTGMHRGDIALNIAGQMLKERHINVAVNFYNGNNNPAPPPRRHWFHSLSVWRPTW